jgi:hypothetical protein
MGVEVWQQQQHHQWHQKRQQHKRKLQAQGAIRWQVCTV